MSTGTSAIGDYKHRISEIADKHLFVGIFLIGVTVIVILKLAHVHQLIITTAALLCMLVYGAYILLTPRYRLRSDRAGDSLYYLGFLFTMVSLAYSLWEFGSEQTGIQAIVTNFGIALATTICGLMLRIAYHQMREDPFDVERQVQIELSNAASKLRGELLSSVTTFKVLSTAIKQTLQESTDSTTTYVSQVVEQTSAVYAKAIEDLAKLTRANAGELQQCQAAVQEAAVNMSRSLNQLGQRFDAASLPTDDVTRQMQAVAAVVESFIGQVGALITSEETRIMRLEAVLAEAENCVRRYSAHLSTLGTEIHRTSLNNRSAGLSNVLGKAKAAILLCFRPFMVKPNRRV